MRTRTYGIDHDTISFAQRVRAGSGKVLSGEPLKQINKFVVGIKRMGLWDSMVCWPMRSIHNAGTGSTVYSLGGLGIYNGTMVNSPTWGLNGIENKNTSGVRAGGGALPIYTDHTALFITKVTGDMATLGQRYFEYGFGGVGGARYLSQVATNPNHNMALWGSTGALYYRAGHAVTLNVFEMMGYSITNGSLLETSKNYSNYTSATPLVAGNGNVGGVGLGNFQSMTSFGVVGVLSSYMLISKAASASLRSSIYFLYRQTICKSLQLP